MNWLDVFIVLFLLAALIRGIEVGFVRQIFSTIGFFVGLFVGVWIESMVISHISSPAGKALAVLIILLGCALLFMTAGEYIGLRVKFKLRESQTAEKIDRGTGSILAAATLLVAVWFGAAIFNTVPNQGWQRQIRGSAIIAALNSDLPSAPSLLTKLGNIIDSNSFPQVFNGLEPDLPVDTPLPDLGTLNPAIERVKTSVVKVEGHGCGGVVEGTGFIADNNLVVTNAHVVAGVTKPVVIDRLGQHATRVVWFDQNLDVAILQASGLAGHTLSLSDKLAISGTNGAVLGYPGGKGFTAGAAVILDTFEANGRNIYNQGEVTRSVYSIRADVEQGNSGGPLISQDGEVIGVIFAKSSNYNEVGYAITSDQIIKAIFNATQQNKQISTGACAQ